jgi:uncharacterized protein (TIGR02246 family)
MLRYGVVLALLCLLAGCSSSMATATRSADVRAIQELEAAWARDIKAKNLEKWVSYYAEDGSILLPHSPPVTGRDNIREALRSRIADPNFSLVFHPSTIEVSENLAYSRGVYEITRTDWRTKAPVTDQGKYVTVYKRQPDGSWKAVQDMASSDMPAASMP